MKSVHLTTCVWGAWHLDMMVRLMWPSILAAGNLPAFARECRATYRICTTRRDRRTLRDLPIFQAVASLVPVEFIDTPTEHPEPQFHMDRFVVAMQEARQAGAIFFNLWPDVVFPDRMMRNAARAIKNGAAGCLLPSFRVVSETCATDVVKSFAPAPDLAMTIAPGDLVRLGVRHLHPLSITGVAGALHGRPDTGLMFRVAGEGFVSRTSCNWLFVDPGRFGITADGAITASEPDPDKAVHIVTDADDLFFLSLAPFYKELETFRPHHANDALDTARLTMLPHVQASPFIEPMDRVCMRLHYGAMTEAVWQPIVERSEAVFRRVRMTRAVMQIWELLKGEGCRQATKLISLALFTLRLPNSLLIEGPMTIFVPSDRAIDALPRDEFGRLIDRRFRRNLLRAMLGHAVAADISSANDNADYEYESATGNSVRIRTIGNKLCVNDAARVLKELRCGPHRICIVDRVLDTGFSPAPV